jgi:hypothetical protein
LNWNNNKKNKINNNRKKEADELCHNRPVKRSASSSNTACKVCTSPKFSNNMLSKSCLIREKMYRKTMYNVNKKNIVKCKYI